MARNPRYNILFEPVRIGPVTAPNRFYQTPHAVGMGMTRVQSSAAVRGIKAEGGWGVVCTEYCSIDPSCDDSPFGFLRLWDDQDMRDVAKIADAIHAHGSLAGIELWHGGSHGANRQTREPLLAPSARPGMFSPIATARAMDKSDIREFRQWQRAAALRAKHAGFDIVYVYAGHDYLPFQFLSRRLNTRSDEYGGTLENRTRLIREMLEDTKEAVGGSCAVALRLSVDELHGPCGITSEGEGRDAVALLGEVPDLWDVNVSGSLGNDSRSSRFSAEGFQESHVAFVKSFTTKPVVSVGRFTSPDTMVSQIKRGIQDFIGAARPSIADPFLPQKIAEGREDEIRECIGCNICRSANNEAVHIRCTQNPTMGEEWRSGWHPERIAPRHADEKILIVGGGPSGLEAALALASRGYGVMLAEKSNQLGGRLLREASLPGLGNWMRVRDHREYMLTKFPNAEIFRGSAMTADDIADLGVSHVVLATGSTWRRDGIGVIGEEAVDLPGSLTPDDVFAGAEVQGPVIIYDDEHYFMGGALAERLKREGLDVTLVTPAAIASSWTAYTDEQAFVQKRLLELGVSIRPLLAISGFDGQAARFACVYTGRETSLPCGTLMSVTGRLPDDSLYHALKTRADVPFQTLTRIGDCLAPGLIADAVYSGHRFARGFGGTEPARSTRIERVTA
ncbi:FAD-dependent oxidoreductase [Aestuariivirga sp.]|uniref:oxidoreductase n=1 Tax=Aestuariivirga sp. TaxID=2650926 RepID=UPI0039E5DA69